MDKHSYLLKRHHNPFKPITRSFSEKIIFWFAECTVVLSLYYFLTDQGVGSGLSEILYFQENPLELPSLPISFYISLLFIMIVSKMFKTTAVLVGAVLGEVLFEFQTHMSYSALSITFLAIIVIFQGVSQYKGGEYYPDLHIIKEYFKIIALFMIYLPFIYLFLDFNGFPTTNSINLTENNAKIYVMLIFLTDGLIITFIYLLFFYGLDRFLYSYFPVSDEELSLLFDDIEKTDDEPDVESDKEAFVVNEIKSGHELDNYEWYDTELLLPIPGELYMENLTHHPLHKDDHTIAIMIGKTRVYLCTRCTGMILGAMLAFLYHILLLDFGYTISPKYAFYLSMTLPILPISDWGLQALHIRPANTISRLFTGFILGLSIFLLSIANTTLTYFLPVVIGTLIYFALFGVLSVGRSKIERKADNEL